MLMTRRRKQRKVLDHFLRLLFLNKEGLQKDYSSFVNLFYFVGFNLLVIQNNILSYGCMYSSIVGDIWTIIFLIE